MSLARTLVENLKDLDARIQSIEDHLKIAKGAKERTAKLAAEVLHGVREKTLVDFGGQTLEVHQVRVGADIAPEAITQKPWVVVKMGDTLRALPPTHWKTLSEKGGHDAG